MEIECSDARRWTPEDRIEEDMQDGEGNESIT